MATRAHLPKSVKIAGNKWRVICKRSVKDDAGEAVHGLCDFEARVISVSVESQDDYEILSHFYHELGHAVLYEAGVELEANVEHAILKQLESVLAANCEYRERPRKRKKLAA